jgi:CBS domain-containing protein
MKVSDVMTCGVISLSPNDTMLKAARLMMQYGVSGFPVVAHGKLVGIITQGDFLRRAEIGTAQPCMPSAGASIGQLAEALHAHGRKIGEVMTSNVLTVTEDATLEEAVSLMERNRVKRLPVVKGGAVIGIINRVNVLHAFILGSGEPSGAATDDDIRDRLTATLNAEPWAPSGSLDILVENGRVDLRGVIFDERQRLALRVVAENARGVKAVSDHLELRHAAAP